MTPPRHRLLRSGARAAAALVLLAAASQARPARARDADDVLRDHAAALGGAAPWQKRRALRVRQTITLRNLNLSGHGEVLLARDGRFLISQDLPPVGRVDKAFDGKQLWARDQIGGLRVVEGGEAAQTRLEGTWMADLRLSELFPQRRLVPARAEGQECVELERPGLPAQVRCFDTATHLEVSRSARILSPYGETPVTIRFLDWRDVGGVKMAHRQEADIGPVTADVVVTAVEWNPRFPAAVFRRPRR